MRPPDTCSATEGCITCGDTAVALTVVAIEQADARCRDAAGREERVATELVGPVEVGDRLLVHAGVAIEALPPDGGPEARQEPDEKRR